MSTKHMHFVAESRDKAGKGTARAARRAGLIPAVIYGDHKEPVMISLPTNAVHKEYHKGHFFTHLCDIEVEGKKHLVLARDAQLDPVRDDILHVDFLRVTAKTKIAVKIPVHFLNEDDSKGLNAGGILSVVRHEVELYCSATDIPEALEIDLTGFEIGDAIKISDVTLPAGTKPVIERDFTIATIAAPKTAAQLEAEEAAEAAADAAEAEAPAEEEEAKEE